MQKNRPAKNITEEAEHLLEQAIIYYYFTIIGAVANQDQAQGIMDLIEQRWNDLVGRMPIKICFPAIENEEWKIVTGCDRSEKYSLVLS